MADNELERIYTIPLRDVKHGSRNKMANRAVKEVRAYLSKHMKSEDVWIDDAVNQALWKHGMYKVPSRIRVRAVKFEDGVVEVSLPDEDVTTSIRKRLKDEREAKAPVVPAAGLPEGAAEGPAEIEAEPEEKAPAGEIDAEPEGETKKQS